MLEQTLEPGLACYRWAKYPSTCLICVSVTYPSNDSWITNHNSWCLKSMSHHSDQLVWGGPSRLIRTLILTLELLIDSEVETMTGSRERTSPEPSFNLQWHLTKTQSPSLWVLALTPRVREREIRKEGENLDICSPMITVSLICRAFLIILSTFKW